MLDKAFHFATATTFTYKYPFTSEKKVWSETKYAFAQSMTLDYIVYNLHR